MKDNLWVLTEERPKISVVKSIVTDTWKDESI